MNEAQLTPCFGPFALRPVQRQLLLHGAPVKVGARAFDLLLVLVNNRHRPVSKAELFEQVWPLTVVLDNNLDVHLWALRKLLGARAILNIPGRGYRFVLPVDGDQPSVAPAPPPAALPMPLPTHLPERLPALIGRAAELQALRQLIERHPLVTLTGLGGAGKTLLALHLLHQQRLQHAHGVCWVDLAPLQDASRVAATVAAALALPLPPGDTLQALGKAAASLQVLLALDNAELLAPEVATVVKTLLAQAPGLRIVVTTQIPLQLAAERLFQVGPLASPLGVVGVDEALDFGAVALFVDRVQAQRRAFRLDATNLQGVCELCRRLDGSPLAIELAAARVPLLGVQGLLAALDQRLSVLTKGRADSPARQQTLRAALVWSHSLLSEDERRVFRSLAVFSGSFALDVARALLTAAGQEDGALLDALDTLVDRGLLEVLAGDLPRYRLLESPRALAAEQLASGGQLAQLQKRHAHATAAQLVRLHDLLRDGQLLADDFAQQLEPDLDNGRAAMQWAVAHDRALAVGLAWPLAQALGSLRFAEVEQLWQDTENLVDDGLPVRLQATWKLGAAVFRHLRRPALANTLAQQAATMLRDLQDELGLARALCVLASGRVRGVGDEQRDALLELRALCKPGWPAQLRMHVATTESVHAFQQGDMAAVKEHLRRWVALAREAGSDADLQVATNNLAEVALSAGDAAEAVRLGRELERRLGHSRSARSLATCRMNLTAALLAVGDVAEARAAAERGWPLAAAYALQTYWLDSLALLAALEGRPRAAARLWGRADAAYVSKAEQRQINEMRTAERVATLLRTVFDEGSLAQLHGAGAAMGDAEVAALAFARADVH